MLLPGLGKFIPNPLNPAFGLFKRAYILNDIICIAGFFIDGKLGLHDVFGFGHGYAVARCQPFGLDFRLDINHQELVEKKLQRP